MRFTSVQRAAKAGRQNLTGFDPKKFAAAAGVKGNDPWARAEAWRYSGPFTRWNRWKGSLPGFGIATVAFTAYCLYEAYFPIGQHGEIHYEDEHHKKH